MDEGGARDELPGLGHEVRPLPVSPSLESVIAAAHVPPSAGSLLDRHTVWLGVMCLGLGVVAALCAQLLIRLIALITNLSFFGKLSFAGALPASNHLGMWVIGVPVIGGLIVGVMAKFGSRAIRGHGIPETMEKVLLEDSRIPPRMTLLKPLSAAISIGTGGPFGAEGPIIATGGAIGSVLGQFLKTTADERKTLLAAGAAAGMSATFGAPVAAVLLAIELLLFEFRPRSVIPVALASTSAAGVRMIFEGAHAVFPMQDVAAPSGMALACYVAFGAIIGIVSVGVTRVVYWIEDMFEKLPIHWMWWPAIGTLAVGICGYFSPRTLGVGYDVISDMLTGSFTTSVIALLFIMKFLSWSISLGSGTSGGTLAPLFTLGGALGTLLGIGGAALLPGVGIDPRIAALVGMAAMFAGASRALLTSVVFAFEVTLQPMGLLPLLGGCAAAYMLSSLLMRESIMTEKLARRGVRVPNEYHPDPLVQLSVKDVQTCEVAVLSETQSVREVREWIASGAQGSRHTGFPIIGKDGLLIGVLTRRDLTESGGAPVEVDSTLGALIRRPPVIVYEDCTLRDAVDHMVNHDVGRLPVVRRDNPGRVVGIITRSTVLAAHRGRLREMERSEPNLRLPRWD
ncbi:MAG: chloride channel protein [Phycisphaeraceae bacterium]|nr:chloride channel protein [Phycisphaeraceae bacterium]